MNRYDIIISRAGVPFESWEADAPTQRDAIDGCRSARTTSASHDAADVYVAVPHEVDDDIAVAFARADATRHMPALEGVTAC